MKYLVLNNPLLPELQNIIDVFEIDCIVHFNEISHGICKKIQSGCESYGEYVRLVNDFVFKMNLFASDKEKVILFLSSVNPIFSFLLSQKATLLVPNVDVVFSNIEFQNFIEVLL